MGVTAHAQVEIEEGAGDWFPVSRWQLDKDYNFMMAYSKVSPNIRLSNEGTMVMLRLPDGTTSLLPRDTLSEWYQQAMKGVEAPGLKAAPLLGIEACDQCRKKE